MADGIDNQQPLDHVIVACVRLQVHRVVIQIQSDLDKRAMDTYGEIMYMKHLMPSLKAIQALPDEVIKSYTDSDKRKIRNEYDPCELVLEVLTSLSIHSQPWEPYREVFGPYNKCLGWVLWRSCEFLSHGISYSHGLF